MVFEMLIELEHAEGENVARGFCKGLVAASSAHDASVSAAAHLQTRGYRVLEIDEVRRVTVRIARSYDDETRAAIAEVERSGGALFSDVHGYDEP